MIYSEILSWLKLLMRVAINSATSLVIYPLASSKLGPEKFIFIIQALSIGLLYATICRGGLNITSIADYVNHKDLNSVDGKIEKLITVKGIIFSYTILPIVLALGVYTIATSNYSQFLTTSIIIALSGISSVLDLAWILEIYGHYSSLLLISSISTISAIILAYTPGLTAFSLITPTLISALLTFFKTYKQNSNIRLKRILTNILPIDIRAFKEKKIYASKDFKVVTTGLAISALLIITQAFPAFALPLAFPNLKNLVANYLVIDRLSLALSGVSSLYVTINIKKLFANIKPHEKEGNSRHNKTRNMLFFSIKLLIVSSLITFSTVHGLESLPSSVNIVNILQSMRIQDQTLFRINTIALTLMSYLVLHSSNEINAYCSLFICLIQVLLTPTIFLAIKITGQSTALNPFAWMEANSIAIIIIFFTYFLYIREYNSQN